MSGNAFSKEEVVAYEQLLTGFETMLTLSEHVSVYRTDQTQMERSNDTIWRPMPYISSSFAGTDMTTNFQSETQLSVPVQIGFGRSVPWTLTSKELRDALQERRIIDSAKQRLSSDVELAILNAAIFNSGLTVARSVAASGFDDYAQIDAIFNETGVPQGDRAAVVGTRDYNGQASNLQVASRTFGNAVSDEALRAGHVGTILGFDTYKKDNVPRIAAAAGVGNTISTLAAAGNYWVPKATTVAATGETSNVDNRFQVVTVNSTANVKAGDRFTIQDVEAVHLITKQGTGQLKTFTVVAVNSGTTMTITPPIVSNQGGTDAEAQYKNCNVTPAAGRTITWLNIKTAAANPFWHRDALEIIPGRYAVPTNAGAGIMAESTSQGFQVVMQKFYDIRTMNTLYRVDILFGVACKQPEMAGVILYGQA